jgi:hypothetical protein
VKQTWTVLVGALLLAMCGTAEARWLSVDPVKAQAGRAETFNRYHYAANNPYTFTDPDGREIRIANPADRARVERMVNSLAVGVYRVNSQGSLQQVQASGDTSRFSSHYAGRLNQAISSDKTINVAIGSTYTHPQTGEAIQVNGGLTQALGSGLSDQNVMVTGESFTGDILNSTGSSLTESPAMILMHELVGHAIPGAVGSDTGNAVSNENKVRIEIPEADLRKREPDHVE